MLTVFDSDLISPGSGEAAPSHMIQSLRLTATRRRDFQEPSVVKPWAPPQRRTSLDKIYNNVLQPQLRQEVVQDQDYDVELMEKQ